MKAKQLCERIPLQTEQLKELLERLKHQLQPQDYQLIGSLLQTLEVLFALIQRARMSIGRLRRLLFGAKTEKLHPLQGAVKNPPNSDKKAKLKNHGRNGADQFPGARKIKVPHPTLKAGDPCSECERGKLSLKEPVRLLYFIGQPLFAATIYVLERLRCNLCGAVFTAPPPPQVGLHKYDPTVGAMIGINRYQAGLPFNRAAQLQQSFGMPLAASTQWQIAQASAEELKPVYQQLIHEAAQASLVHNDDTHMRVLSLGQAIAQEQAQPDSPQKPKRTGLFTSSVVCLVQDHRIALFKTGRQHAGENLAEVLVHRAAELPPPIQMCDALSSNYPKNFVTIIANCIPHGRRGFVDVFQSFPQQCRRVLDDLAQVFKFETETKGMSAEQRLAYHQANSQPIMDGLHQWLQDQFDQKLAEPNSGLGQAIKYMLKHWEPLTLFLRQPGAPLSNNICERALKMAIRHRKNSLFYKTENGAEVGDIFMSLIHTCQLNQVDPFQYLTTLLSHPQQLAASPAQWLPWNFPQNLPRVDTG